MRKSADILDKEISIVGEADHVESAASAFVVLAIPRVRGDIFDVICRVILADE